MPRVTRLWIRSLDHGEPQKDVWSMRVVGIKVVLLKGSKYSALRRIRRHRPQSYGIATTLRPTYILLYIYMEPLGMLYGLHGPKLTVRLALEKDCWCRLNYELSAACLGLVFGGDNIGRYGKLVTLAV